MILQADKDVRPYSSFEIFRKVRRGRCPHRPKGTVEFAGDFRKNGFIRRGNVGIAPYALIRNMMIKGRNEA